MRGREGAPTLITNFAVKKTGDPENPYRVRRLPRIGAPIFSKDANGTRHREPNIKIPKSDMESATNTFLQHAETAHLDVGQRGPSPVKMLRIITIGYGEDRKNPESTPAEAIMSIDDDRGNSVQFALNIQPGHIDGEDRLWDSRVVTRLQSATINGEHITLTDDLKKDGLIFLTNGMGEILQKVKEGKQPIMTTRQETNDHVCFPNGHHGSAGKRELACYCDEERKMSLTIIHDRGGINCLIPDPGNGNGGQKQDRQLSANTSRLLIGKDARPFQEVYRRQGLGGDNRNTTLRVATFIMEHLFQVKDVPNITTLTESRIKQNIWHSFGATHTVQGESLNVTPPDHPDSRYKQQAYGYTRADQVPFPLQPR